ncbi:MAG: c-type cytochrome [Burkholderiales bacterium]
MRMLPSLMATALCLAVMSAGVFADQERKTPRKSDTTSTSGSTSGTSSGSTTGGGSTTAPPGSTTAALNAEGEGRRAYLKYNCYGCHGMNATGGMGPNIVHEDAGDVSEAVRRGEGEGMPAYGTLVTTTEINNIAAYLRSIGTAREPKFNDWWMPVPTK